MICNKIHYPDKALALKEAKRIKADYKHFKKSGSKDSNKKFSAYFCEECDCWHLTSQKKRKY